MSLLVFSDITGLDTSTHFACRIREAGAASWSTSFVWMSTADTLVKDDSVDIQNGFDFYALANWTSSWVSFEVAENAAIELEVEKLHGDATISLAIPRPAHRASASLSSGKAYVTMTGPQQVNIDIDGTFELDNTGLGNMFTERIAPRHSFTIFANPMLSAAERPDPTSADVLTVSPGETPPADFNETTLYFLPGVHNLSAIPACCSTRVLADACECTSDSSSAGYVAPYKLKSYKQYYVPTDAWLEGWFKSYGDGPVWGAGDGYGVHSMKLFGYGTVSGINMYWKSAAAINTNKVPKGLWLRAATNCTVMGLMFVDYNMHTVILFGGSLGGDTEDDRNTITHYKALGWRTNSDGLHLFGHWNDVTDLWLRTADDSLYIGDEGSSTTYRRIVTWNDANGAPFLFGQANGGPTTLEDSDVIYHRKQWPYWCGSVFNLRWESHHNSINNFTIRDIRITDPYPTCPLLNIEGSMRNVYMKNVVMDAHSSLTTLPSWYCTQSYTTSKYRFDLSNDYGCNLPYGIPNSFLGYGCTGDQCDASRLDVNINISNFLFEGVTINGTDLAELYYDTPGAFNVSGSVYDINFIRPSPISPPSTPPGVTASPPPPSPPAATPMPAPPPLPSPPAFVRLWWPPPPSPPSPISPPPSPPSPPAGPSSGDGDIAAIVGGVVGGVVVILAIAAAVYFMKVKGKRMENKVKPAPAAVKQEAVGSVPAA